MADRPDGGTGPRRGRPPGEDPRQGRPSAEDSPRGKPPTEDSRRPTLAVDLDGTIARWAPGGFPEIGEPVEGARYFLQLLRREGWKIIVHTCRAGPDQEGAVARWLQAHDIPYDEINHNPDYPWATAKPVADVYLDDRGVSFRGDWQEAYQKIQELWHRRGREGYGREARPGPGSSDRE